MTNTINVGIGGLGAIGMPVARWLDVGVAGLGLAGVAAGDGDLVAAAQRLARHLQTDAAAAAGDQDLRHVVSSRECFSITR